MTINNKSERNYRGKCLGWPVTSYGAGDALPSTIFIHIRCRLYCLFSSYIMLVFTHYIFQRERETNRSLDGLPRRAVN